MKMEAPKIKEKSSSHSSKGGGKKTRISIAQNKQKNGQKHSETKKVILNLIKPAEVEIPLTTGFDYRSQMGQFGWVTINKIHIPYIFRSESTKYVALRIINQVLFPHLLSAFRQELFDLFPLRCFTMTDTERILYNEINFIHTNGAYGLNSFLGGVQLVLLEDALRLFDFLSYLYNKMILRTQNLHQDFGFKTFLSPSHIIPFVKVNGVNCYPMLYFEAEKGFLMQHSTIIDDFFTKILKALMNIQNINCNLNEFRVITQCVISKYFDPKQIFSDTWPAQMNLVYCNNSRSNESNLKFTNADNPEEMAVALREMTQIKGMSYLKYSSGYHKVAVVLKDFQKDRNK